MENIKLKAWVKVMCYELVDGVWKSKWVLADVLTYHINKRSIRYRYFNEDGACSTRDNKSDFYILEYTGVKDKCDDAMDLYSGYIVKFKYNGKQIIGLVEREAGSFIIVSNDLENGYLYLNEITCKSESHYWFDGYVIGNKFENKEWSDHYE